MCHSTGAPIPEARLRAKPWAKYTKDAAEGIQERDPLKTQGPDVGKDNLLRLFGSEHGL